jgi:putative phosphoribosyl transferase
MRFRDRTEAGRTLAEQLRPLKLSRPVVLALPKGGVPVAFEIAAARDVPRAIRLGTVGALGHPQFAIAAGAEVEGLVVNRDALLVLGLSSQDFEALVADERHELGRR